jgi:hypothetical protein
VSAGESPTRCEGCSSIAAAGEMQKLRFWRKEWKRGREGASVRYYGPGRAHHAIAKAEKLRSRGYIVEIESAAVHKFDAVES